MNRHDLVYLDDIIDAIEKNMPHAIFDDCGHYTMRGMRLLDVISAVPVVQSRRKRGKWVLSYSNYRIKSDAWYRCDQCENETQYSTNFCPNCGADMRDNSDE